MQNETKGVEDGCLVGVPNGVADSQEEDQISSTEDFCGQASSICSRQPSGPDHRDQTVFPYAIGRSVIVAY